VRLLLIGSLPPPLGGTAISFAQLVRELRQRDDLEIEVLDTSRGEVSGWVWTAFTGLRTLWNAWGRVGAAEVVTFHASTPATVLFAPILALLCIIRRRPLVIREFGGSFDSDFAALAAPCRQVVGWALRRSWLLLQTRSLVDHFEQVLPGARCRWYANSRPWTPGSVPGGARSMGARRFIFVGHVKPEKGIYELLEAARRLGPRDLRVDVYGPLLDGIRSEDFAGHPVTAYRGVLPPEQVAAVLRTYDVLVLPTYHPGEGYPGAILEAYAAGLPVIATRWRSIPEIVEHGVSGLLTEPGDADALARAIADLYDHPNRMNALRRGALARAESFSSRRWTQEFVDVCRAARKLVNDTTDD
jgi:glycosyltransferase involved in cell wall biosynthesis